MNKLQEDYYIIGEKFITRRTIKQFIKQYYGIHKTRTYTIFVVEKMGHIKFSFNIEPINGKISHIIVNNNKIIYKETGNYEILRQLYKEIEQTSLV